MIRPPASQLGPIAPAERAEVLAASPLAGRYDVTVDRDSAFERLARRAAMAAAEAEAAEGARDYKAGRRYSGSTAAELPGLLRVGAATASARPLPSPSPGR